MASRLTSDPRILFIDTHYRRLDLRKRWQDPNRWNRLSQSMKLPIEAMARMAGIPLFSLAKWRKEGVLRPTLSQCIILTVFEHSILGEIVPNDTIANVFPHVEERT